MRFSILATLISCYTGMDSKVGFLLRQLGCKFLILTRALPLGNGRSFRMQKLRRFLAKFPTFESISV